MPTFNYHNIIERDIDRIICEELYCSIEFFNLFLSKVNRLGGEICSIEHSKREAHGETDIEVIYLYEGNKYAMLIEDKITACKQPEQAERYRLRGDNGIKAGNYCAYDTFLVAPQIYVENPVNDADKYDHVLTHDEIAEYFKKSKDPHSEFRMKCFKSSLTKHEFSSQSMRSRSIPGFFVDYASYLEECDIDNLQINKLPAGEVKEKSGWIQFESALNNSYIQHKILNKDPENSNKPSGFIDLRLKKYSVNEIDKIQNVVDAIIAKSENLKDKAILTAVGRTHVCIRMKVIPIFRCAELSGQKNTLHKIFDAISDIYDLSKSLEMAGI